MLLFQLLSEMLKQDVYSELQTVNTMIFLYFHYHAFPSSQYFPRRHFAQVDVVQRS